MGTVCIGDNIDDVRFEMLVIEFLQTLCHHWFWIQQNRPCFWKHLCFSNILMIAACRAERFPYWLYWYREPLKPSLAAEMQAYNIAITMKFIIPRLFVFVQLWRGLTRDIDQNYDFFHREVILKIRHFSC